MSALPQRLAEFLPRLVPGSPAVFDEIPRLYADTIRFRDPIQGVHGIAAFVDLNRRLLGRMQTLEWQIHAAIGDESYAVLEWTMRGKPKRGPALAVDGVTRVHAAGGRIVDHRDYWDLSELVASTVSFGERVRRAILRPLA
ncbi:MAG: nuclear transport factor 2 family protein [Deltaproteobacteria bacterium]|nr:nuclear transport factor 2 family protein [Deltaproteobacteria bacterium]